MTLILALEHFAFVKNDNSDEGDDEGGDRDIDDIDDGDGNEAS